MEYSIIRSRRKTLTLEVTATLEVIVRAPLTMSDGDIEKFVIKNSAWIERAREKHRINSENTVYLSDKEVNELYKKAKEILPVRVKYYAEIMGVTPTKITITHAKKRFGSCSGKNALCFSVQLMACHPEAIDYVIVHELAHIKHHNHSKDFYAFIEKYMPDYKRREKLLREKTIVF